MRDEPLSKAGFQKILEMIYEPGGTPDYVEYWGGKMIETEHYTVTLSGCDDSTQVEFDFRPDELHMMRVLAAKLNKAAESGCQPLLILNEVERDDDS